MEVEKEEEEEAKKEQEEQEERKRRKLEKWVMEFCSFNMDEMWKEKERQFYTPSTFKRLRWFVSKAIDQPLYLSYQLAR